MEIPIRGVSAHIALRILPAVLRIAMICYAKVPFSFHHELPR